LRLKQLAALLLTLVIAALAVGCGGDDSSDAADADSSSESNSTFTTSSLNKDQYIKRVNAICVKAREDRLEAFEAYLKDEPAKSPEDDVLAVAIKETFPERMEEQVAEIRELGVPEGDAAEVQGFLVAFENSAEDASAMTDLDSKAPFDKSFSKAGVLAKEYGIDECAVG